MLNLSISYPVNSDKFVIGATEASVIQDESVLFGGSSGPNNSDVSLTALALPAAVAIAQIGTAGTSAYTYVVADISCVGVAPAAGVQTTAGNANLSTANANTITWTAVVGHTYNVYRSASNGTPSGTGFIGQVLASVATIAGVTTPSSVTETFVDTGIVATLNVPTANTTGAISLAGPLFGSALVLSLGTPQTVTSTAAATWTVANMATAMLIRAGATGSAVSDVTPTAAALVAALPGVKAGQSFRFWFKNTTGFGVSITGGTGVTVTGTASVATVNTRECLVVFANATPGTESVTVYTGPQAAY